MVNSSSLHVEGRQSTSHLCNHNYPSREAFELEQAPVPCHAPFILPNMSFCAHVNMKQRKHTLHGQEHKPFPQSVALDWKTPKLHFLDSAAMIPEVGQMLCVQGLTECERQGLGVCIYNKEPLLSFTKGQDYDDLFRSLN